MSKDATLYPTPAARFGGARQVFISLITTAAFSVFVFAPAMADVVTDWNERVVSTSIAARQNSPAQTRCIAMVHLAIFDVLNSIEPRFTPYRMQEPVPKVASPVAAVGAAAHYLMARLYPGQAKDIDAAWAAELASVADGDAKTAGMQLGEKIAASLLQERRIDGAEATDTYRPLTAPWMYVPTVLPIASGWGAVRPFALKSGDQFRPQPPYALNTSRWAIDYNEVKRMGVKAGSGRSEQQTEIARFWEFTGAGTYNPLVRQISTAKNLGLLENARLFALVSMATADGYIAVFDAKYAYNFWRPITAIRNGDLDGNDATERDAAWEPIIATPMHPEYPCAHCITQASAASVLGALFGNGVPAVQLTSPTAPGVTRRFTQLSDYVTEVINARVYDGVHYRASGEIGAEMGRQIGSYVVQNFLKPVQ
jgi:PAP2 superfamily